tara:strand:- start:127 stop:429 length:303 start_codon:yes stop_codon:yes gene_type:complete
MKIIKTILKIILSTVIAFLTLLTFYNISKLKVDWIETSIVEYFNNLFGDYGFVWIIVILINLTLIIDILFKKFNAQKKFGLSMSILAIPFSNIVYIWKRD